MERKVPNVWIVLYHISVANIYICWRIMADAQDCRLYAIIVRYYCNPVLLEIGEKCQSTLC